MDRELAQIRVQGYAVDNLERFQKGRGIAVPVLDSDGRAIAAMLCLGRFDNSQDQQLVQQMTALAKEMSDRLSASGDLPAAAADALPTLESPA